MKIIWLVNNINQVGGIEQVICGLSNHFVHTCGYDVEIISINTSESRLFFHLDESIHVKHYGLDWRVQTPKKLNNLIRDVLKALDGDILITCHSPISIGAVMNKHLFKGKIIVTQHCAYDFESKKRRILNALAYRFADTFVVLTESDCKHYRKLGCKSIVIPNAIYSSIGSRTSLNDHILLSAGRLTAVKGFDMLIDAFSKVADNHPQWKLCICGNGEDAEALQQQADSLGIAERVLFPGFVNISEYMSKAGCFALSSRSEGFSLVLIEAMAHGLPVVSYALPAPQEICGNQGALFVPRNDTDALAEEIDKLLSSDELRHKLGEEAYELAKKYSISAIAARWTTLFDQLVK